MSTEILVVCTGNICRSAYAEWRLADLLRGTEYTVASAGTRAVVGDPMHPLAAEVLERQGVSGGNHVAVQLTKEIARGAGLVLAMTREHRTAIVQLAPACLRTTYTLLEVQRLLSLIDTAELPDEPDPRLRALVNGLRMARGTLAARPEDDDIADPIGLPLAAFEQMADEVEPAVAALARVLRGA